VTRSVEAAPIAGSGSARLRPGATPFGRLGTPEDIAEVAVILARDEVRFVTGTCLTADGSLTAVVNAGPVASYTARTGTPRAQETAPLQPSVELPPYE
jgi:NAD(P)-dependent dehydrogenase (short-subunit alcohol dehydrogenase family)